MTTATIPELTGERALRYADAASLRHLKTALQRVNHSIWRRPMVVISGPVGSGKSFLAREILRVHGVAEPVAQAHPGNGSGWAAVLKDAEKAGYLFLEDCRRLDSSVLASFLGARRLQLITGPDGRKTIVKADPIVIITGETVRLASSLIGYADRIFLA